jgi:glutamine synthetase
MTALREAGDALESLVPQNVWPLPTYREMLFMK